MATFADWNLLDCAECRLEPRLIALNDDEPQACSHCGKKVSVHVFPALLRPVSAEPAAEPAMVAGEAQCFYHGVKKASVVCDECGRFLCELCDIDFKGRHYCTSCLERASAEAAKPVAGKRYVHYDSIALTWAIGGVLIWFISFITASVALYYVVRHWRSPLSILPRRRWRFVVAGIVSLATLGLWSFFALQLVGNMFS